MRSRRAQGSLSFRGAVPEASAPFADSPAIQETLTTSQGLDAEQHRKGVYAIDRGQGRKPCKRGERGDAKDRSPQPSVLLSDRIHYAPRSSSPRRRPCGRPRLGGPILLILSCALPITYSFPPYRAALDDRLTRVHSALSWSPWLALLPLARWCPQTLRLVTTSATPKVSAQKPILTLRTGSPPSGLIDEPAGLDTLG